MQVKHVGIITGGANPQQDINTDHAKDIGGALEKSFSISYYNLSVAGDIERLLENRSQKKLDIVFNNAAGKRGGDGTVEGFLEIMGIPYIGSDTLATAAAFDKKTTKAVVADAGVPVI